MVQNNINSFIGMLIGAWEMSYWSEGDTSKKTDTMFVHMRHLLTMLMYENRQFMYDNRHQLLHILASKPIATWTADGEFFIQQNSDII